MRSFYAAAALLAILSGGAAYAASLSVAPAKLDLVAPAATATLTLRNDDTHPITVQIRVFRWQQAGGMDRLEPTDDVVASPPMTVLPPQADYTVRIVRVSKVPVAGEESYRLLIDELPDRSRQIPGAVTFVLRYSLPVFFASPNVAQPHLFWAVQAQGKAVVVIAKNAGGRHLRIADLTLTDARGTLADLSGLVGYVLPGSSMRLPLPRMRQGPIVGPVTLSAQGEEGVINATATVESDR